MKDRLQNDNGFSLIELMLIVGIISILTSIAAIAYKDMYANYKLKGAARQVYSDMQYARLLAIKQGDETLIDFEKDASGDVYYSPKWKADGKKLGRLDTKIYLTGTEAKYEGIKACHPTDAGSALKDVEFNPNGTSTLDSRTGIKLSKGDKVYLVYVSSWGTGNIRILNKTQLVTEGKDVSTCP